MTSSDPWEWKVNTPEFVPGVLHGVNSGVLGGGLQGASNTWSASARPEASESSPPSSVQLRPCAAPGGPILSPGFMGQTAPGHQTLFSQPCIGVTDFRPVGPFPGPSTFFSLAPGPMLPGSGPATFVEVPARPMVPCVGPMTGVIGMAGHPGGCMPPPQQHFQPTPAPQETEEFSAVREAQIKARYRAQYENEVKAKEDELKQLQDRLQREEGQRAQMKAEYERDKRGLLKHLNQLTTAVERAGIPVNEQRQPKQHLESKMDQLNSLIQNRQAASLGESTVRPNRRFQTQPEQNAGWSRNVDPVGSSSSSKSRPYSETKPDAMKQRVADLPVAPAPSLRPQAVSSTIATSWNAARFEKLAKQQHGAFQLRERFCSSEGTSFDLRIRMGELDSPLNDEGMQIYCRWLHQALQRTREVHGIKALRDIRAEVSFSMNAMGDDAVSRLISSLQRLDLRIASLNLSGNAITPSGLGPVCDLVHGASFAVTEVNLSHNFLDDNSAFDFLRIFVDHSRYPPRSNSTAATSREATDFVKICLGGNCIRNVQKVLRRMEGLPGITIQLAPGRAPVKEWYVLKHGLPLLALPSFDTQELPEELASKDNVRHWQRVSARQPESSIGGRIQRPPPPLPPPPPPPPPRISNDDSSTMDGPSSTSSSSFETVTIPEETPEPDPSQNLLSERPAVQTLPKSRKHQRQEAVKQKHRKRIEAQGTLEEADSEDESDAEEVVLQTSAKLKDASDNKPEASQPPDHTQLAERPVSPTEQPSQRMIIAPKILQRPSTQP